MKTARIGIFSATFLLAATTIWADGKFSRPVYAPSIPMPTLSSTYVNKLVVNSSNLERTVAQDKCESQGIREIAELMKSSTFEEMWVFIPDAEPSKKCKWIEIGRDAIAAAHEATVKVDRTFLAKAMVEHNELHLYHFHPLAYFETCGDGIICDELSLPITASQISEKGLLSNLRYGMPSPEDIYFMMDISWEFDQRRGGDAKIVNRVVTPYGVLDYALTEEGRQRFEMERGLRTAGLYIKLVAANALFDDNIHRIVKKNPDSISSVVQQLVQSMNNKNLRVTLIPLETYQP